MRRVMKRIFAVAILATVLGLDALGDTAIQQAQETLKEQGYYYGQITGEKNADTVAAIRRFQIRNGLQVTGDLNEETLRALNSNTAASVQTATPAPRPNESRAAAEAGDDLRSEPPQQAGPTIPRAVKPGEIYASPPAQMRSDVFADTPYATAPPQLHRQILLGVETSLRRRGLYRGELDGVFGPELEFSLRDYQTRVGLLSTGRLDMDTLASLQLLPGQPGPQRLRRRGTIEPPVRGEWIH